MVGAAQHLEEVGLRDAVLLAVVLELEVQGVGDVHQLEVDLPVPAVDRFGPLQMRQQVRPDQLVGVDAVQRVEVPDDFPDERAVVLLPMVHAVFEEFLELGRPGLDLGGVVDEGEAQVDVALVDLDVPTLRRRQAGGAAAT